MIPRLKLAFALSLVLYAISTGCAQHADGAGDDHAHGAEAGDDDHGHGHGPPTQNHTVWTQTGQLFVEFPALIAGQNSKFAAHITDLEGHRAFDEGRVAVVLSGGGNPDERFSIDVASRAGLFQPVVAPLHPGERFIRIDFTLGARSETFKLGPVRVFATEGRAIDLSPESPEVPGAISFLLEQQWVTEFGIHQAKIQSIRPNIAVFGALRTPSGAEAIIHAPRAGRLDPELAPKIGTVLESGAPLARLFAPPNDAPDDASLKLARDQASIAVRAEKKEVDRLGPLVKSGVVAPRRLDLAKARYDKARAASRSARTRLKNFETTQEVGGGGESVSIPSPLKGVYTERFAAPGSWVEAGEPIARVVANDPLWLELAVPEGYLAGIADTGGISGAWFTLGKGPRVYEVSADDLISTGPEVDPKTRSLPVRFQINNPDGRLFPGLSADGRLITAPPRDTVAIPVRALVDDSGVDVVYVQTGGETFERRPVRLGHRDGTFIEVISGVSAGEWLVSEGAYTVKIASTATASVGHGHSH